MIQVVVDNLNIDANYIFIVQKEHYEQYNLEIVLNLVKPKLYYSASLKELQRVLLVLHY